MSDDTSIAAAEPGIEAESSVETPAPVYETGEEKLEARLTELSKKHNAGNASEEAPTEEPEQEALDSEDPSDHNAEEEALANELLEDEADTPEPLSIDFAGTKFEYKEGELTPEMAERVQETIKGFEGAQTRKSQELAEMRKTVEEAKASVEKIQALDGQALQLFTNGQQLKREIERIEQIDMMALRQSSPDQARFLSDDLSTYRSQLAQVTNEVDRLETASSEAQKVEMDRVMEQGRKDVLKYDPDFMKNESAIIEYVKSTYGMTDEQAKSWPLNPASASMADKARRFDDLQARLKAKKPAKIPKPVPTKAVKGRGTTVKSNFSKMNAGERKAYLGLPG